ARTDRRALRLAGEPGAAARALRPGDGHARPRRVRRLAGCALCRHARPHARARALSRARRGAAPPPLRHAARDAGRRAPPPAAAVDVRFGRVQFTPDLMPSDIIGTSILDPRAGDARFRPGPLFTDLLLADEINRASAKTQAALLEAMQERAATVDGTRHPLGP